MNEIFKEIHGKHGNRYSDDQKRAWAHLIEMGKHESVIQPPKKRFFQSPPTILPYLVAWVLEGNLTTC